MSHWCATHGETHACATCISADEALHRGCTLAEGHPTLVLLDETRAKLAAVEAERDVLRAELGNPSYVSQLLRSALVENDELTAKLAAAEARLFLASGDDEVLGALRRSLAAAETRIAWLESEGLSAAEESGAAAMQAAIVAWLRRSNLTIEGYWDDGIADLIESGAHLRSTEGER